METCERDTLILNYLPLANKLAWEKKKKVPPCVDIDELKSAAYMGLVKAANRFNPECKVPFPTYARFRIYGEILDYLRELMWDRNVKICTLDHEMLEILCYHHENADTGEFFGKVTKFLSAIGQKVVMLYYIENRTLKEIGTVLNLTESRISQILKQSREKIKRIFSEEDLRYEIAA
jgi:RNA polymerase sigma factor (sigma-70 family)